MPYKKPEDRRKYERLYKRRKRNATPRWTTRERLRSLNTAFPNLWEIEMVSLQEKEIICLYLKGFPAREVGDKLGVSHSLVLKRVNCLIEFLDGQVN